MRPAAGALAVVLGLSLAGADGHPASVDVRIRAVSVDLADGMTQGISTDALLEALAGRRHWWERRRRPEGDESGYELPAFGKVMKALSRFGTVSLLLDVELEAKAGVPALVREAETRDVSSPGGERVRVRAEAEVLVTAQPLAAEQIALAIRIELEETPETAEWGRRADSLALVQEVDVISGVGRTVLLSDLVTAEDPRGGWKNRQIIYFVSPALPGG